MFELAVQRAPNTAEQMFKLSLLYRVTVMCNVYIIYNVQLSVLCANPPLWHKNGNLPKIQLCPHGDCTEMPTLVCLPHLQKLWCDDCRVVVFFNEMKEALPYLLLISIIQQGKLLRIWNSLCLLSVHKIWPLQELYAKVMYKIYWGKEDIIHLA